MIYEIQYQSLFLPVGPNEELGSQVINEFEDENTEQFYDGGIPKSLYRYYHYGRFIFS